MRVRYKDGVQHELSLDVRLLTDDTEWERLGEPKTKLKLAHTRLVCWTCGAPTKHAAFCTEAKRKQGPSWLRQAQEGLQRLRQALAAPPAVAASTATTTPAQPAPPAAVPPAPSVAGPTPAATAATAPEAGDADEADELVIEDDDSEDGVESKSLLKTLGRYTRIYIGILKRGPLANLEVRNGKVTQVDWRSAGGNLVVGNRFPYPLGREVTTNKALWRLWETEELHFMAWLLQDSFIVLHDPQAFDNMYLPENFELRCTHAACQRLLERNGYGTARVEKRSGTEMVVHVGITFVCRGCKCAVGDRKTSWYSVFDLMEQFPPVVQLALAVVPSKRVMMGTQQLALLLAQRELGTPFETMVRAEKEAASTRLADLELERVAVLKHVAIRTPLLHVPHATSMLLETPPSFFTTSAKTKAKAYMNEVDRQIPTIGGARYGFVRFAQSLAVDHVFLDGYKGRTSEAKYASANILTSTGLVLHHRLLQDKSLRSIEPALTMVQRTAREKFGIDVGIIFTDNPAQDEATLKRATKRPDGTSARVAADVFHLIYFISKELRAHHPLRALMMGQLAEVFLKPLASDVSALEARLIADGMSAEEAYNKTRQRSWVRRHPTVRRVLNSSQEMSAALAKFAADALKVPNLTLGGFAKAIQHGQKCIDRGWVIDLMDEAAAWMDVGDNKVVHLRGTSIVESFHACERDAQIGLCEVPMQHRLTLRVAWRFSLSSLISRHGTVLPYFLTDPTRLDRLALALTDAAKIPTFKVANQSNVVRGWTFVGENAVPSEYKDAVDCGALGLGAASSVAAAFEQYERSRAQAREAEAAQVMLHGDGPAPKDGADGEDDVDEDDAEHALTWKLVSQRVAKPFKTADEAKILRRLVPDFVRAKFAEHVANGSVSQALWSAIDTNSVKDCIDHARLCNKFNFLVIEALARPSPSDRVIVVGDARVHVDDTSFKETYHVEVALAAYAQSVTVNVAQGGRHAVPQLARVVLPPATAMPMAGLPVLGPEQPDAAAPLPALPHVPAAVLNATAAAIESAVDPGGAVGETSGRCVCCNRAGNHAAKGVETCPWFRWVTDAAPDPRITRPSKNHGKRAVARTLWLESEELRREVRARYGGASSSAAQPAAPQPGPAAAAAGLGN